MKVQPKNDDVRRLLKHPTARGFRAQGPASWPNDSFTARRLKDGDITLAEETAKSETPQGEEAAQAAHKTRRTNKES